MRTALIALALAIVITPAAATMATLTEMPKGANVEACRAWAARQDDEARTMWGMLRAGGSSEDVGVMRLTLRCLGDAQPDIVGFGSSAGANEAYCRRHKTDGICASSR